MENGNDEHSAAPLCYASRVYIVAQTPVSQSDLLFAVNLHLYSSSPAGAWQRLLEHCPRVSRKEWKRRGNKAVKVSLVMTAD